MANRSGVGVQCGIATETTYGTYVAPSTFQEVTQPTLNLNQEYVKTAGLRAGRAVQSENLHQLTTRQVEGSISMDAMDQGLGKWLNLLHPNTVTPASLTGGLYRQTHNIGNSGLSDPFGKSATIQVGMPDVAGTVHPFSAVGCKVAAVTFAIERSGVVTCEFSIDGQDIDTSKSLASATYAAAATPFSFLGAEIEFDDVVLTNCARGATITITFPLATDRFCIGGGALKKEPILNGQIEIGMTLDMEFSSLTQYTAFRNATRRKVELTCAGQNTSGTYGSALNFTAASTVPVDANPEVSGPDLLSQSVELEVVDDGSSTPFVIEYITADSTL